MSANQSKGSEHTAAAAAGKDKSAGAPAPPSKNLSILFEAFKKDSATPINEHGKRSAEREDEDGQRRLSLLQQWRLGAYGSWSAKHLSEGRFTKDDADDMFKSGQGFKTEFKANHESNNPVTGEHSL